MLQSPHMRQASKATAALLPTPAPALRPLVCRWPNSVKAHQLVLLAQQQGKGREAKELLFQLAYEEGKNISLVEELVDAAEKLGLGVPADEVRLYLEQDQGRQEVMADDKLGKRE